MRGVVVAQRDAVTSKVPGPQEEGAGVGGTLGTGVGERVGEIEVVGKMETLGETEVVGETEILGETDVVGETETLGIEVGAMLS